MKGGRSERFCLPSFYGHDELNVPSINENLDHGCWINDQRIVRS